MKHYILAMFIFSASFQAIASGTLTNAKIQSIRTDASGKGVIYFDQDLAGSPSCVTTDYIRALSFDAATAGGKAALTIALAAKTAGSSMSVYGNGTCTNYGGKFIEDWLSGYLY